MIVKVQTSFSAPPMALVYDERQSVQGQFPAAELPTRVKRAVKRGGGRAYFHAKMVGTKIDFDTEATGLMLDW